MFKMYKIFLVFFGFSISYIFIGCNNTSEPETFFEASDRYSNHLSFPSSVNQVVVTNPIGFIYLFGNTDITKVSYVLDRKVNAKSKSIAESELKTINLEYTVSNDTLYCNIVHHKDLNNFYDCTLNLDVPFNKDVIIKNPNKGIHSAYLNSNLKVETDAYETIIEQHTGSVEARSTAGNIVSIISIPQNGFCRCISETGDIIARIPTSASVNVELKTTFGSISYSNLNLNITTFTNQLITGTLGNGEGDIYLESNYGEVKLEGF